MIHGFMGGPLQFERLANEVYQQGYSVLVPLLPGHGKRYQEFTKSRAEDWKSHIDSEVEKAAKTYRRIFLVGHSMGGLLALAASRLEPHVKGVFLLSSPMKLRNPLSPAFNRLRVSLKSKNGGEDILAAYRRGSVPPPPIYLLPSMLAPAKELKNLIKEVSDHLGEITVPVIAVNSRRDETVSFESLALFDAALTRSNHECIALTESMHAYYAPKERSIIVEKLFELLKSET